jgi:uncharacterized membrane protein
LNNTFSNTQKLTISGLVIAIYVVLMYFTRPFAFGAVQIRIATGLYALSYLFPFLILPLGIANLVSNFTMGGIGFWDAAGGMVVGILTSGGIYLIRRLRLPRFFAIPVIIAGPGLLVPIWLSPVAGVPYPALALSLCAGQILPAIAGYLLISAFIRMGVEQR